MINVRIENLSSVKIDNKVVMNIIEKAGLPDGDLLVILSKDGIGRRYGACIPRDTLEFAAPRSAFRRFANDTWDVSVAVSRDVCAQHTTHPAYFAYILGHELGHAVICFTDLELHILTCLIDMFIRPASADKITMPHETPHERCFDQFGIYLVRHILSQDQLNNDIRKLLADKSREDHKHLEHMFSLQASNDLSNLRRESINFLRPYKEQFIALCRQHVINTKGHSIAAKIDVEKLLQ